MIGLGRWTGTIETSMISGSAVVEITDNNGEYAFSVETDSIKTIPNFTVYDIVESDNTLSGKADIELMGKVSVQIFVEFTSDTTFKGYIKVPFFGKFEIKNGRKLSHWIWYIFPQQKGLGHSHNSEFYGLEGIEEAAAYWAHPILSARLREICEALLTHKGKREIDFIMGSRVDVMKLQTCMNLFNKVAPNDIFKEVLETFF